MPPAGTKEPAILTSWAAKSPSLRPTSHYSQMMNDSVTSRHQPIRSPLSASSFPKESKPLTQEEVDSMFAGAPQFEVTDDAVKSQPRVVLKGNATGNFDHARDVDDLAHSTFEAASLAVDERSGTVDQHNETVGGEALLHEIPNMRSLAGRDPGTVGHAYFLQLPTSDSRLTAKIDETTSKRVDLLNDPETVGLKALDVGNLVDRLSELSEEHRSHKERQEQSLNEQKAAEMYTDLFARLLVTPKYSSTSEDDPTGLEVQIRSLTETLDMPGLWYDFSFVEWRIQLGQLLWSTPEEQSETDSDDEVAATGRDIVLLQITLASELLTRLNLSTESLQKRELSKKIQWDLILAQRFLDNVRIAPKPVEDNKQNRSSVFSAMTFFTAKETPEDVSVEPILYPRNERRQVEGLLEFAEALSWPHMEEIDQRFKERLRQHSLLTPGSTPVYVPAIGAYATPVATPGASTSVQTGYFEAAVPAPAASRPQVGRSATAQSVQLLAAAAYGTDALDAGGWLSRSWLTGLVLPGEPSSHFLISTLLENSPRAIEVLGDSANLYGGFIYSGRSYWSKSCVVGRVLAAEKGSGDCMGWISSCSVPALHAQGWVDVETKNFPSSVEPRISSQGLVAKDSAFVRGKDNGSVEEDDLTWPVDSPPVMGNEARYEGLVLEPTTASSKLALTDKKTASPTSSTSSKEALSPTPTSTASLKFAGKSLSSKLRITLSLTHDIYFVSSHPCFPSPRPSESRKNSLLQVQPPSPTDEKELPDPPCHPLHSSYSMEVVPAATLLSCAMDEFKGEDGHVIVLDCRGSEELQLLGRAWCAQVGENAIVGKVGRTCLSCCVREANGLGIKVVIRV